MKDEAISAQGNSNPLCKCGCGKYVKWNNWHNKWNTYLKGHYGFKFKKGGRLSDEHKRKISIANKNNQAFKGRKHSAETKKKLSEINKGKTHSDETKMLISSKRKSQKFSDETKEKLSLSILGAWLRKRKHTDHQYCDSWFGKQGIEYRESIRKQRCEFCGMSNEESIKKSGKRLSDIHIDGKKNDNRPNNIRTACCSCHLKFDWAVGNRR